MGGKPGREEGSPLQGREMGPRGSRGGFSPEWTDRQRSQADEQVPEGLGMAGASLPRARHSGRCDVVVRPAGPANSVPALDHDRVRPVDGRRAHRRRPAGPLASGDWRRSRAARDRLGAEQRDESDLAAAQVASSRPWDSRLTLQQRGRGILLAHQVSRRREGAPGGFREERRAR